MKEEGEEQGCYGEEIKKKTFKKLEETAAKQKTFLNLLLIEKGLLER